MLYDLGELLQLRDMAARADKYPGSSTDQNAN